MKRKLITSVVLVTLFLNICGCAQSTTNLPEEKGAIEESLPVVENTHEEELLVEEFEVPAQEQAITEKPPSEEDEVETVPEEILETATDAEDYENSEVYKEFMEMMEAMGGSPVQSAETAPVAPEAEPYYEEPFERPTRSEEEALAIVTEIADNFKSGPYYPTLEGAALEYLDVNLDTLRNNPKSNSTLKTYIEYYENGSSSEERFRYSIESWIRIAGPYGSKKITVQ